MEFIITLIFLDLIVVVLVCRFHFATQKRHFRRIESRARDRLLYIQSLIDLIYTYKHNPVLLESHLTQQVSIKKILSHHVIDDECEKYIPKDLKILKTDMLLYTLYQEGFSYRELCVIFELNNLNSVYVKYHRINKKLTQQELKDKDEKSSLSE